MDKKEKKKWSLRRKILVALCVALTLVLVLLVAATAYLEGVLGLINRTDPDKNHSGMSESEYMDSVLEDETLDPDFTGPEMDPNDVVWGNSTQIEKTADVINILLIGQDRRQGEGRSRSDAMILCTINKKEKTLTLSSFMRDMYVQIPGHKDNRINASYAMGGMKLLDECLNKNFGVTIDGNIEVDFFGFMKAIDLVGGVEIELTSSEASYLNKHGNWDVEDNARKWNLKKGVNTLNGSQAVAYSRIRKIGNGDFGRTNRHRIVLNALLEKAKTMSITKLNALLLEVLPLLTTDLSNAQIMGFTLELFPILSDLTVNTQQIPADGTYKMTNIRGMSVILPDLEKNTKILEQIMKTK
ncbi:MAG: LCP family protein [Oscillospiraceae bacterium]|nr:LCP family protein [Oscillospiraceae bacterium]